MINPQESDPIFELHPSRPYTRQDILKSTVFGLLIPAVAVAIHFLIHGQYTYNYQIAAWLLSIFSIIILALNLTSRKTQLITLNQHDSYLQLKYLTLFRKENELVIPFEKLSFDYRIKHSKYPPLKFRLKLFILNNKVYTIDTNEDGFNKAQFDELVEKLIHMNIKGNR